MGSTMLVLALCAILPLVNGQCMMSALEKGATRCQDLTDNSWHKIGSTWKNSKCVECSCTSRGMTCCESLPDLVDASEDCEIMYDHKKCTFKVVNKKNPSEKCLYELIFK